MLSITFCISISNFGSDVQELLDSIDIVALVVPEWFELLFKSFSFESDTVVELFVIISDCFDASLEIIKLNKQ